LVCEIVSERARRGAAPFFGLGANQVRIDVVEKVNGVSRTEETANGLVQGNRCRPGSWSAIVVQARA